MSKDYFKLGDWNVICDQCGFEFKGSELQRRWDGAMVCKDDWEPRPPQEYVTGIKENMTVPYSRPETPDKSNTGSLQIKAGATTLTSSNLGLDGKVTAVVLEQIYGTLQGPVTITIDPSIVIGNTVVISGMTTAGVQVTIINNGTGTLIQEA